MQPNHGQRVVHLDQLLVLALASATDNRFDATPLFYFIPTWVLQAALLTLSQVFFGSPPLATRIAFIDLVLLMPSSHMTNGLGIIEQ